MEDEQTPLQVIAERIDGNCGVTTVHGHGRCLFTRKSPEQLAEDLLEALDDAGFVIVNGAEYAALAEKVEGLEVDLDLAQNSRW